MLPSCGYISLLPLTLPPLWPNGDRSHGLFSFPFFTILSFLVQSAVRATTEGTWWKETNCGERVGRNREEKHAVVPEWQLEGLMIPSKHDDRVSYGLLCSTSASSAFVIFLWRAEATAAAIVAIRGIVYGSRRAATDYRS